LSGIRWIVSPLSCSSLLVLDRIASGSQLNALGFRDVGSFCPRLGLSVLVKRFLEVLQKARVGVAGSSGRGEGLVPGPFLDPQLEDRLVDQMNVQIRNILVGIPDSWPSEFVLRQQFVPNVPVFQNPVPTCLVVKGAAFLQCMVEEIHPRLSQFDGFILRGIDGADLVLRFQAAVCHQTRTDVLVAQWTRIDSHDEFGKLCAGIEICHEIDIVGGNRLQILVREWLLLDVFLEIIGHVNVYAPKTKDEAFDVLVGL